MRKVIVIMAMTLLIASILPVVSSDNNVDNYETKNELLVFENFECHNDMINWNPAKGYLYVCPVTSEHTESIVLDDVSPRLTMMDTPDYFNWKDHEGQDWTTPAKDQGNCGSCWDFAALGALESVINIKEGWSELNPDLSEQYVLSCLPSAANNYGQGCLGGTPWQAFAYIQLNDSRGNYCNGIILESCMPYQANDDIPCEEKCEDWEEYLVPITVYGQTWWLDHDNSTLNKIKTRIIEGGPVAAGMDVTDNFYTWGYSHHDPNEYYPDTQEQEWNQYLNHMIVIVGWKDDSSIGNGGYWICKNSWGTSWGYEGFFNIEYGALFTGWYTAWVDYDPESFYWANEPDPPSAPIITGSTSGTAGTEYRYVFNAVDPNGDNVSYYIDWGDNTTTEWTVLSSSGEDVELAHTWEEEDEYIIKAKARDIYDAEGEWGELTVSMPKTKATNPFILSIFKRYPLLARLLYHES